LELRSVTGFSISLLVLGWHAACSVLR